MEKLARSIIERGAIVDGKVYKIPRIGRSFEVPQFNDVSPEYAGTLHVERNDTSIDMAYAAAAKYHTVYLATKSSALKYRSNLEIMRLYEPYVQTGVSIFLTANGDFLEPRKVDVIVANDISPMLRIEDVLAACSSYEVTVVNEEFTGKLIPYIYKYRGLVRCLVD